MENETIKNLIRSKMEGWDGMPAQAGPFPPRKREEMYEWGQDMSAWARAVRRDILVLEHHVKALGVNQKDLYGDPGDPPPPPD